MADTEIPVIMRFLAETEDLQRGTEEVEDSAEKSFGELETLAEEVARSAQRSVDQIADAFVELETRAIQTGLAVVTALSGGASLALAELGKSSVQAASGFEDLRTRIQGMTGDAEEAAKIFSEGVEFSSDAPFSIESIESAVGTLEAFGQHGKENLTLVGDIAASVGGDLEQFSLRVSKALAGSSDGFTSLRDTAGITGERLAEYGAIINEAGNVSLQSAEEIEAARQALIAFGKNEVGGSMELLSSTYSGAVANVGNSLKLFKATVGEAFLPALTALLQGFATGVNAVTAFIEPFSGLIGVVGAFTTAITGAIGVTAGFAIPFAGVIAKVVLARKALNLARGALISFGASSTILNVVQARMTALAVTTGGGTVAMRAFNAAGTFFATRVAPGVVAGLSLVRTAAQAVIASPVAPIFAAAAVAAGLGTIAINSYAKAQKELSESLDESSRKLQGARTQFREYSRILEEASGQEFTPNADVGETARESAAALKELSAVEVASAVRAAGKDLRVLNSDLAQNRKQADGARERLNLLKEALNNTNGGLVAVGRQSEEAQKVLKELFGNETLIDAEKVRNAYAGLVIEFEDLGKARVVLQGMIDALGLIPENLDQAKASAESLGQFLNFAGRLTSIEQLNSALDLTNNEITDIENNLQTALGTLDRFELTRRLGDPNTDKEQVEVIKQYLSLLDSRASLEKKVVDETEKARSAEIAAYELVTERRKVLGDLTLSEERKRVRAQLSFVEEGTEEEVAILKRLASLDEEIRRDRLKKTKDLVAQQVREVEDALSSVRSRPDSTNADVADQLRDSIRTLEAFEKANSKAFAQAPEELDRYRRRVADLKRELQSVEADQLTDQLRNFQRAVDEGLSADLTTVQKIEGTQIAIDALKKSIAAGVVPRVAGEQAVTDLERQKLDLIKQQTDEKLKQANEIAQLELRALDEEIQILELRRQAGEDVDRQLEESRRKRLDLSIEAIEKEKEAAIKAGADVTQAEKKAELQRQSLVRKEAIRDFQEQGQAAAGQIGQIARSTDGFAQAALGRSVKNTPFSPVLGGGPSATPSFLPDFARGFGVSAFAGRERPKAPDFNAALRRIDQQQKARGDRVKIGETSQLPPSQVVNMKQTINFPDTGGDFVVQQLRKAGKAYADQERQKRLRQSGTTTSPIDLGGQP